MGRRWSETISTKRTQSTSSVTCPPCVVCPQHMQAWIYMHTHTRTYTSGIPYRQCPPPPGYPPFCIKKWKELGHPVPQKLSGLWILAQIVQSLLYPQGPFGQASRCDWPSGCLVKLIQQVWFFFFIYITDFPKLPYFNQLSWEKWQRVGLGNITKISYPDIANFISQ